MPLAKAFKRLFGAETPHLKTRTKGEKKMANLKELLGESYKDGMSLTEIDEALSSKKIVDLGSGQYVSKDKYKSLEDELKVSQTNLTESLTKIAGLEKTAGDNKALTDEILKLKSDIENQKTEYEARASKRERDYLSTDLIKEYGAKNVKAVKALLGDVFDLDNAEIKDGKIIGLEEALDTVKNENDYLFNLTTPTIPKAGKEIGKPPVMTKEEELLKVALKAAGVANKEK